MKFNFFSLIVSLLLLNACSRINETSTETSSEPSFFNLKVGNLWVYKTFDRNDYSSEFKFTGNIDSVQIISQASLNNKVYYKIKTSSSNVNKPTLLPQISYTYWRVNEKGHLVDLYEYYFNQGNTSDSLEKVRHPGRDYAYIYDDQSLNSYGTYVYKLYPEKNMTIENQNYVVLPYNGLFTPNSNNQNLISKIQENNYKEGIGLVKTVCHSLTGTYNYETRLSSYNLK